MTIEKISNSFNVEGDFLGYEELSTGNINSTFRVRFLVGGVEEHYIIQKINKRVFHEPFAVMDNIVRVTAYVRKNIVKKGLSSDKFVLHVFTAKDDERPFVVDDAGEYWRCYQFIQNAVTYDSVEKLLLIEKVGQAFGLFQNCLDGFRADSLAITIPNFHNTKERFSFFKKAIELDPLGRAKDIKEDVQSLIEMERDACMLQEYLDNGMLPLRVTHNDTKCNNVSFDGITDQPLAVLDLDTVMPGAVAFDFGDGIRSIASTCFEDEKDYGKVKLDLDKYTAFTKGFVGQLKDKLTELEKNTLNYGVLAMTVELAVRFLGDYVMGDKYFKIKYPEHNLTRGRNQLALALDIAKKRKQMDMILEKIYKE